MSGKYIYEVLIRGAADGIRGAHVIEAVDSVNPLTNEPRTDIGAAKPIELGAGLESVLGSATTVALSQNNVLQQQVSQQQVQISELTSERDRLVTSNESLEGRIQEANERADGLSNELTAVVAERDLLKEQLAQLQTVLAGAAKQPEIQA